MSFLVQYTHTNKNKQIKIRRRKEHDSFLAHHSQQISHNRLERASSFTSKGSLTLEAALAAPIFFFGVLCLAFLMEMMVIQITMKSALREVGREMAKEAYMKPVLLTGRMEEDIIEKIGEQRFVYDIDCSKSKMFPNTAVMELSLRYQLEVPIFMFHIPLLSREETVRIKGWTGYAASSFGNSREDMVYVTENGVVYHKDPECTYLELSIQSVPKKDVKNLRNEDGGKYYPCELCARKKKKHVYITNTGNRYHSSISCGGLKRSVYAVPVSEVYGRGGCSRCVK